MTSKLVPSASKFRWSITTGHGWSVCPVYALIRKMFIDPISVLHPFTLLPLFGQLLLFITLWQKQVSKRLTYLGIGCLGLLLLLIFIIGCMGLNLKIMLSAVPFILMAIVTILYHQKSNTSFPCG